MIDRSKIDKAIQEIRERTQAYRELSDAHHFLYDLPFDKHQRSAEIVLLGLNPGETASDRDKVRGPVEETSQRDFHGYDPTLARERWRALCQKVIGKRSIVQGNLFFWSSAGVTEAKDRFGPFKKSPHLEFCVDRLKLLIDHYQPAAVVVTGISQRLLFEQCFNLTHVWSEKLNGIRLVEQYARQDCPWFITRHFSGSRMSNVQLAHMSAYLRRHLPPCV